jgi:hypothetical protein
MVSQPDQQCRQQGGQATPPQQTFYRTVERLERFLAGSEAASSQSTARSACSC